VVCYNINSASYTFVNANVARVKVILLTVPFMLSLSFVER